MKLLAITTLIIVLGITIVFIKSLKSKNTSKKKLSAILKKTPLTKNEQPMFFRLVESLPENIVLAQVAFSALLKTTEQTTRNKFDRKVADFVICNKAFEVIAIIELDDSSHKGKEEQDAERDSLLINAGYKVIRYKKTPDISIVKKDIYDITIPKTDTSKQHEQTKQK